MKAVLILVAWAVALTAAPVRIYDANVQDAGGNPANGRLEVQLSAPCTDVGTGRTYTQQKLTVPVAAGVVDVSLQPTTACRQLNVWYEVIYILSNDSERRRRVWRVPQSGAPHLVSAVEYEAPPAWGIPIGPKLTRTDQGLDLAPGVLDASYFANNAISNAKLADMAAATLKGNNTGGTADPLDLTVAQVKAMLGYAASDLSNGVTGSGAVVLATSPTLVTPVIASLANANHSHQNAAGGGTLDGSAIASGTIDVGRISQAAVTQHQAALSVATSQLTGTLADARVAQSNVTQHQSAFAIAQSQVTGLVSALAGKAASIHVHDTADITTGTFADARIAQSNVTQHQAALAIGAAQVGAGVVSNTEFGYLDGVTSAIQTQLGHKQDFPRIVFEGDSLSDGIGTTSWNGRYVALSALAANAVRNNVSAGGESVATMVSQYSSQVQPLKPTSALEEVRLFVLGGTNDLSAGRTAAQIYADLQTEWASAKADGFQLVVFTVPPSTALTGSKETERVALNALIRGNSLLYDYLVPFDELLTDPTDGTYFSDGTHLTQAGATVVARGVMAVVDKQAFHSSLFTPLGVMGVHLNASGGVLSRPDTDTQSVFGRTAIGHGVFSDYAWLSHYDMRSSGTGFALLQDANGRTFINSASGQSLTFNIGGNAIASFSPGSSVFNVFSNGQDSGISIGNSSTTSHYSYLNIQGDTTYAAGIQLIRYNGGANTTSQLIHRGTGPLDVVVQEAGTYNIYTNGDLRFSINASGITSLLGGLNLSGIASASGTPDSVCLNGIAVVRNSALTCTVSSRQFKTGIQAIAVDPTPLISRLRPVEFAYKDHPNRSRYGFIAEEVASVDRRLADGYDYAGVARSLDQNAIIALIVAEVHKQRGEIELLKASVQARKGKQR